MTELHGWFSNEQLKQTKKIHYYLNADNKVIGLTMITPDENPDLSTSYFKDFKYMGTFLKWVKNENLS